MDKSQVLLIFQPSNIFSVAFKGIQYTTESLVTIRMNEIFPCLACYGQKPSSFVRKSRQSASSVKGSGEDEVCFTLNLFTKYIVILKILMDN